MRRRDLALAGPKRGSRRSLIAVALILGFVLLLIAWVALQTLGSTSSKQGAAAISRSF